MKAKKIYVILIVVLFLIAVLSCCYFTFNISKVEISYSINEEADISEITDDLNEYKGKNLIFFDLEQISSTLKNYEYFELVSVRKSYPATLKIEIKERREVFAIKNDGQVFVVSDNGYIFNVYEKDYFEQNNTLNLIDLDLVGVNVLSETKGDFIETDNPMFINSVFEMAKKIELTDCVKSIEAVSAVEKKNVVFKTYTGVEIVVYDSDDEGLRKIANQFLKYEGLSDYQKAYGYIYITKLDETGEIIATWSEVNSKE